MPSYSHTLSVAAAPATIFAILDNTNRTPEWLTRCTGIDTLTDGANRVGTKLRYHYKTGPTQGQMSGEITAYEPARHFAMHFTDKMMDVTVDFVTAAAGEGTSLTHTIDITTKGVGKLFTPLIKLTLPRQTVNAMTRLKALAENRAEA